MSGQVVAVAAEQRHRRVPVAVDEAGDQRVAVAVELVVAGLRRHVGAERDDDAVDGPQRRPRSPSSTTSVTQSASLTTLGQARGGARRGRR